MEMYGDVGEFHAKFSNLNLVLPTWRSSGVPHLLSDKDFGDRLTFMLEELAETAAAHRAKDLVKVVDGIADLVWVSLGTAHFMMLPFNDVWEEVYRANMDKAFMPENKFGVGKPPGWREPGITAILKTYGWGA